MNYSKKCAALGLNCHILFYFSCRQTLTMSNPDLLTISLASNIMPGRWVIHNWISYQQTVLCCCVTSGRLMVNLSVSVRSCMTSEGSWRRTGTPSEMTSCLFSKTAGITPSVPCMLNTHLYDSGKYSFYTHMLCTVLLQARLHLRPLWARREQKWWRDPKDGHSPTKAHRKLSVQGETGTSNLSAHDCMIVSSTRQWVNCLSCAAAYNNYLASNIWLYFLGMISVSGGTEKKRGKKSCRDVGGRRTQSENDGWWHVWNMWLWRWRGLEWRGLA